MDIDNAEVQQGILIANGNLIFDTTCNSLSPWSLDAFRWGPFEFDSTLRFMSWMKARYYQKDEIAEQVMQLPTPQETAALVDTLGPANDPEWNSKAMQYLQEAYIKRLTTKVELLHLFAATMHGQILFAHKNLRWGTGLGLQQTASTELCSGENQLGKVLMGLRDTYFSEVITYINKGDGEITEHDLKAIEGRVRYFLELGNEKLGLDLNMPEIQFNQRGVLPSRHKNNTLRINPVLLNENWDEFMLKVIPHEVAHMVAEKKWGRAIQPHGDEWAGVMRVFRVPAEVNIELCTVNAMTSKGERHVYACGCGLRFVSQAQHEHIAEVGKSCPKCSQEMHHCYPESVLNDDEELQRELAFDE